MTVVGMAFGITHLQIEQSLLSLGQARSSCVVAYAAVLQVFKPFLQRCRGYFVELIHTDDIVFGEDVRGGHHANGIPVTRVDDEQVLSMYAYELVLTMIEVVGTLAQVEVDNADRVHLLHLVVLVAQSHMLRDGLGNAVENALQIVELTRLLNLHQDNLALRVPGFDVDAVELVVLSFLIAFALKQLHNGHLLVEQHRHQPFQHRKVGLVAQHAFRRPVKSYVLIHLILLFAIANIVKK